MSTCLTEDSGLQIKTARNTVRDFPRCTWELSAYLPFGNIPHFSHLILQWVSLYGLQNPGEIAKVHARTSPVGKVWAALIIAGLNCAHRKKCNCKCLTYTVHRLKKKKIKTSGDFLSRPLQLEVNLNQNQTISASCRKLRSKFYGLGPPLI